MVVLSCQLGGCVSSHGWWWAWVVFMGAGSPLWVAVCFACVGWLLSFFDGLDHVSGWALFTITWG